MNVKRRKYKLKKKPAFIAGLILILLIIGVVAACGQLQKNEGSSADGEQNAKSKSAAEEVKASEPIKLSIDCIGDIMMHTPQLGGMYGADGNIDLSTYFAYTQPIISGADLSLANMETTFAGEPFGGYPNFSSPDELAAFIKGAGIDVGITSNNHMLDRGVAGARRTVEVAKAAGLEVVGSRLDPAEKNYIVLDVNGVKVGVVSYTYETIRVDGQRTMNGSFMSEEAKSMINSYNPDEAADDAEIVKSIEGAKADGAEIVVCYFHWGNEYERQANDTQRRTAQLAVDNGADLIFASHPHVLQPMELLLHSDGASDNAASHAVPVFWSMGNYISNQRQETLENHYTEQGIIAQVNLTYEPAGSKISEIEAVYTPLWVDKYDDGRKIFAVIPLIDGFQSNPSLQISGNAGRAENALAEIRELLGENLQWSAK
ncbi:MAG: CapA family protein [Clostridiales Family XIII bacterium]|jgi:poly-gamma-glutamate synthesis protein (capsule biosynthesis protein)|nr:CapA family protein [Clostridiales Family XIII bacterium]